MEEAARLAALVARVIAIKVELDTLDADEADAPRVRPHPPASYERLAQVRRAFEARGFAMPRELEWLLRLHDGIDHLWCTPSGSLTLFSHHGLLGAWAPVPIAEARDGVVIAASDSGDAVCLAPAPVLALVLGDPRGRVVARFASVTAWLEWVLRASSDERADRTAGGRRRARWPAPIAS
ncbi:MAG: hypothetical protein K8W52_19875 [Deltaproteobacteria bacterium]|nr:hypothetical protein [Deltaproteobacteria bacterium]